MTYYISRTGASLRFATDGGSMFLMISEIKSIRGMGDNLIKIETGCCFSSIFINTYDVAYPPSHETQSVVATLNQWITNFLTANPNPEPPAPSPPDNTY